MARPQAEALRRIVRQDDAEIQIAVPAGVAPRFRAKKVDTNRPIELDQPPGNLFDRLLFGHDLSHYPSSSHFRYDPLSSNASDAMDGQATTRLL